MPMTPYNVPVGTKVTDLVPRPRWLDDTLTGKGFNVGDLVTYIPGGGYYDTNMVIYRIVVDSPPNGEVVCTEVMSSRRPNAFKRKIWALPGRRTRLSGNKIKGHVVLEPVFSFFPGRYSPKRRIVAYRNIWLFKKLDILELAKNFSAFQDFIRSESQRLGD